MCHLPPLHLPPTGSLLALDIHRTQHLFTCYLLSHVPLTHLRLSSDISPAYFLPTSDPASRFPFLSLVCLSSPSLYSLLSVVISRHLLASLSISEGTPRVGERTSGFGEYTPGLGEDTSGSGQSACRFGEGTLGLGRNSWNW